MLEDIVKTSIEMHGDSDYTSYSVSAYCVDEIEVSIVAISKKEACEIKEWLKDKTGIEMEMKEIQVSPSLLRIKNVSGESGERTLSNSAGF